MQFEYYVMNYNSNKKKVEPFNIFNNYYVNKETEKEVKKYLRSPKKYKYVAQEKNEYLNREEIAYYGFEGLCKKIDRLIMWQEWGRCEYEISVGDAFITEIYDIVRDLDKFDTLEKLKETLLTENKRNAHLQKIDCYEQCESNIEMITREVIYQYKKQKKMEN